MKILSIETSCDETAVSIIEANGGLTKPYFKVLGNALFSQIEMHKEYGGVFPTVAKREHAKNLPRIIAETLTKAGMYQTDEAQHPETLWSEVQKITEREQGLYEGLRTFCEKIKKPEVDMIVVTAGPGLEPALWVGISGAVALGKIWDLPVVPANHMEGHILSVLVENTDERPVTFPALALLVSGGHTELVNIQNWGEYTVLGQTRDDAVGEAFDKVARMLSLPYPGGPEISRLAQEARDMALPHVAKLPRPMIHSHDLDFSFSGLKTSVLYYIRDHGELSPEDKMDIAREFEDAVVDVLLQKSQTALDEMGAETFIIAGGVIANRKLRSACSALEQTHPGLVVKVPTHLLSTDNALMIACAGYISSQLHPGIVSKNNIIIANGNLSIQTVDKTF